MLGSVEIGLSSPNLWGQIGHVAFLSGFYENPPIAFLSAGFQGVQRFCMACFCSIFLFTLSIVLSKPGFFSDQISGAKLAMIMSFLGSMRLLGFLPVPNIQWFSWICKTKVLSSKGKQRRGSASFGTKFAIVPKFHRRNKKGFS